MTNTHDGTVDEKSALLVQKLTPTEAAMMIVGANIGSGILGLAYASRLAGWPILLLWLVIAGFLTTVSMLYVTETTLRTTKNLQLPGLAEKYVGSVGAWLVFLSVVANSVGCMIAYMAGSGRILGAMFGISNQLGSLLFAVPSVVVVWLGLKATGVSEKIISAGMSILVLVIIAASFLSSKADFGSVMYANWLYAVPVFNVALFCYIAQYLVPELSRGLRHDAKKIAPAIVLGMSITFVLLALVPLAVLVLTGPEKVTQVATIAWGQELGTWAFLTANIFALCAMITSYWAVGGAMLTNIVDKFNLKSEWDTNTRLVCLACVVVPPFILAYSGVVGFVNAIYMAGTFGGVIMSILPVMMLRSARKNGDVEPEYKVGWIAHPAVQNLLIIIFCCGAIYAVGDMLGLLPSGW
jgi:amino acid permease